jgi:hypothetical protein
VNFSQNKYEILKPNKYRAVVGSPIFVTYIYNSYLDEEDVLLELFAVELLELEDVPLLDEALLFVVLPELEDVPLLDDVLPEVEEVLLLDVVLPELEDVPLFVVVLPEVEDVPLFVVVLPEVEDVPLFVVVLPEVEDVPLFVVDELVVVDLLEDDLVLELEHPTKLNAIIAAIKHAKPLLAKPFLLLLSFIVFSPLEILLMPLYFILTSSFLFLKALFAFDDVIISGIS